MRMLWAPCVLLVVAVARAQLEGVLPWGGAYPAARCPDACQCSAVDSSAECRLNNATMANIAREDDQITIKFTCVPIHPSLPPRPFSCADVPPLPFGRGQSVRLALLRCPVPADLGCVAARLDARLTKLTVRDPAELARLSGVEEIEEFSYAENPSATYNISIPELFPTPPPLKTLSFNDVRVALGAGDLGPYPGLVRLELGAAGLGALPRGLLAPLKKLRKLLLFNNQLEDLSDDLKELPSLELLSLSANRLSSVTSLVALPALVVLSVSGNRLAELPALNLTKLERLQLSANRVPLSVSPGALSSMPALKDVDMRMSQISSLPHDTFLNSTSITKLNLSGNKLKQLPAELFRGLDKLVSLDLSGNGLMSLVPEQFPLPNLETLNLDRNMIAALPLSFSSGLGSLRSLSIQHNQLARLAAGSLGGCARLGELRLDHNRLQLEPRKEKLQYEFFDTVFSKLSELSLLSLSHNWIVEYPALNSMISLRTVNLAYNNITKLSYVDLSSVNDKMTVDLRYNKVATVFPLMTATKADRLYEGPISELPDGSDGSSDATFDGGNVWELRANNGDRIKRAVFYLDYNPFYCDCLLYQFALRLNGYHPLDTSEGSFEAYSSGTRCAGPAALQNQTLSRVPLTAYTCPVSESSCPGNCSCLLRPGSSCFELTCSVLPEGFQLNMSYYEDLELDNTKMRLTERPSRIVLDGSVKLLNMSGLGLETLPPGNLSSLTLLDLTNNSLKEFPEDLTRVPSLRVLVAGNPFSCDCGDEESVERMKRAAEEGRVLDWERVKCTGGERVGEVGSGRCFGRRAAWAGGVLGALGVLVAALALLAVRYSLEIRVWLFSKGLCWRWLDGDDEREYDAFVSFCHKDEIFVTRHLVAGLEAEPFKYKLCVHYRDWTPGEWIPKQISDSVANSRRTIIVLSQNFLQSLWGQAEFRTATMSQMQDGRPRLIVVLLEDVAHKELCPELKAYLSTNTYLKWGDPWFWEKLRYALPHRKADAAQQIKQKLQESKLSQARSKLGGLHAQLNEDGVLVNVAHKPQDSLKMQVIDKLQDDLKPMVRADLKLKDIEAIA